MSAAALRKKETYLSSAPPANYIAGLGRGATGFTTRSDIGPARAPTDVGAGAGAPPPQAGRGKGKDEGEGDDGGEDAADHTYDEFAGYGGSLWGNDTPYEKDDEEADRMWESVDKRMDQRRKERREARMREEIKKFRNENPKISAQFVDLKKELSKVSVEEWEALPEVGDVTKRNKRLAQHRPERYIPLPDNLIQQQRLESQSATTVDAREQKFGGMETPIGGTTTDLTAFGDARKTMMKLNLEKMERDSVSGKTVVDPKAVLTDLNSIRVNSDAEIGDIKKARLLLKSVTTTNPGHGPGWIARARLEEVAGNLVAARRIVALGCESAPLNEDVWLEAARLETPENAKKIFARAVRHLPQSVKIWLHAANLESDVRNKKKVLRKALEFLPNSVKLWKAAVELEEPDDARILLDRAVECVPQNVELWLALAHLETYENAKAVLNRARRAIPTEPAIWIAAAKLEEAQGHDDAVRVVIQRAVKMLASHQLLIKREQWLQEAEAAERAGAVVTCQAIVHETIDAGVEDQDKKSTFKEDAASALAAGCMHVARAIYAHALAAFPKKKSLWLLASQLEKKHGTRDALDQLLRKAVSFCPQAEILWLMAAKERWLGGDVDGARQILKEAFDANPNSELIWLAAVKLESENGEVQRARALLERARSLAGTPKVWVKSAKLERDAPGGSHERQCSLLDEALLKYPQHPKFWLMRAAAEESAGRFEAAREMYSRGLKNCSHAVPLWIAAATLEESQGQPSRARALLEKARMHNHKNAELYLAAVRVETRAGNAKIAQSLLSKGLQECPTSGLLWAECIELEAKPQKNARSVDALKKCDSDPHVILAVARVFWADRKLAKAKSWFERVVALQPQYGDAWAFYYKFLLQHGDTAEQQRVLAACVAAEPRKGEYWRRVTKAPENLRVKKVELLLQRVALALPAPG